MKDNALLITIEIKDSIIPIIYEGFFPQQEIKKSKYFLQFDSMKEIYNELIYKSEFITPIIRKENHNLFVKIFLSSSKFEDIEFILERKKKVMKINLKNYIH